MPPPKMIHSSPQDIEQAFYEALEAADLDALMELWADDEPVVCIHPGGPRLEGYHDVRESWREILSSGPLHIRVVPMQRIEGVLISVHNILEQVVVSGGRGQSQVIQVHATNVFHKGPKGWRLVLHHASAALEGEEAEEIEDSGADDITGFDTQPTLH